MASRLAASAALLAQATLLNDAAPIPVPASSIDFEAYNGLWGAGNRFAAAEFFGELRSIASGGQLVKGAGAFVNHLADDVLPFTVEVSVYGESNGIIETHRLTIATAEDSLNAGLVVGILRSTATSVPSDSRAWRCLAT